jgi:PKD repeat protein
VYRWVIAPCVDVAGADFAYAPTQPWLGDTVTFTGTVVTGTAPVNYRWDFDNGSAAQVGNPIAHTFPVAATPYTYTVVMTASNGCPSQDTASHPVAVRSVSVYLPLVLCHY